MTLKIYTRGGDGGETSLFDGTRVDKDSLRIECLGCVDEATSHIGLARCYVEDSAQRDLLLDIQRDLHRLMSSIATSDVDAAGGAPITDDDIKGLEELIDATTARIDKTEAFIAPGSSPAAAHLHVARAVCRRAERRVLTLAKAEPLTDAVAKYLNRLSDALYVLARLSESELNYLRL